MPPSPPVSFRPAGPLGPRPGRPGSPGGPEAEEPGRAARSGPSRGNAGVGDRRPAPPRLPAGPPRLARRAPGPPGRGGGPRGPPGVGAAPTAAPAPPLPPPQMQATSVALSGLLFLAVMSVVQRPLMVSDRTDPATLARSRRLEKLSLRSPGGGGRVSGWILSNLANLGVLGLFLLFEVLRQNLRHGASSDPGSEEEEEEGPGAPDDGFLERCLEASPRVGPATCEFAESFVDDLLESCRALSRRRELLRLEDCLGLGPAFERRGPPRDPPELRVLVPVPPPRGEAFLPEPPPPPPARPRSGRIAVGPECPCERRKAPGGRAVPGAAAGGH
ncbi:LOW QUALITY PROTEIN: inositol 1,4,5-trisphosphate receptor-interacting protein-like 1 [Ornithorhynchus anatinus]|uniref:LOW QUALITY PROTEIN: inositol 1,4,5-trisphosphate receptor-interacting protein-like 1 n=1 Tax=Ornithorhynchus anatinus TaxID=9258 RepID=UPI0010A91EC6|nr:LOW QUALITY PROTEIN: inositol 1,4,5-trisphosphate receptor-interacting protein-like 1 [Ornithorhynchus anatinus]